MHESDDSCTLLNPRGLMAAISAVIYNTSRLRVRSRRGGWRPRRILPCSLQYIMMPRRDLPGSDKQSACYVQDVGLPSALASKLGAPHAFYSELAPGSLGFHIVGFLLGAVLAGAAEPAAGSLGRPNGRILNRGLIN